MEGEPAEVLIMKNKTTERTKRKQQEKEIKWKDITDKDRPLYDEARQKQWGEHLKYNAVRVLSQEQTSIIYRTIDRSRILFSRFAYRDKNAGMRNTQVDVPIKAKARLYRRARRPRPASGGNAYRRTNSY